MKRIVIVGEPSELLEFLGHALVREGYRVQFVHEVRPSASRISRARPNLVIVDGTHSFSIAEQFCEQLRGRPALDGCRVLLFGDMPTPGHGTGSLLVGADAYLERPLHPRAVVDCVRQLLSGKNESYVGPSLIRGDIVLDPSSFRVTRAGKMATLTLGEFRLLYHLASNPNQVMSREELANVVTLRSRSVGQSVNAMVCSLRKKLHEDPLKPDLICTVQGHGYMLRTPKARQEVAKVLPISDRGLDETVDHRRE